MSSSAGSPARTCLNEPAFPNNLNWGLDNRIHAASAGIAGMVPASSAPGAALVSLTGADFSFDPRAFTIWAEAGPAESGLSFDNWGRKFACDYRRPLRSARYEPRYLARNPFFPALPPMTELAGPATPIFRLVPGASSPPAAHSRATNEAARAAAQVTNALAATWLTNAQGCVVYRGGAFPSNYVGNVFVADPSAHVIHRFVVREAGLDFTASRATDETTTEFVASSDIAFRPVQVVNGPDGALYVVDRRNGGDSGRIWRIAPSGFTPPKAPRLSQAKTYDLVAMLSHPNGWQRDTAARLLHERRDPKAVPLLAGVLASSRLPLARLHALHALEGLGALNATHVLTGLRDADARIREHAVRVSEKLVQGGALPDAVWNQLRQMSADPAPRVRYQLAFTVGQAPRRDSDQVLAALLLRDPNDLWVAAAVFSSLGQGAGDLFVLLARDARVRRDPVGREWLRRLAGMIGVRGFEAEVVQVMGVAEQLGAEPVQALTLLHALGEGLRRAGTSLALADRDGRLMPWYDQARSTVLNYTLAEPLRISAMQLLSVSPYPFSNAGDVLLLQVGSGQSEAIQSAALAALGRFDDPRILPALTARWRALTPRLRGDAFSALLARTNRVAAVLDVIENGRLDSADLSSTQKNFLRTHHDPEIRRRALQLLGPVPGRRPDAMQRLKPALGLKGGATRGRDIFLARCAGCHQRGPAGQAFGPDLAGARIYGREKVLTAILEPNAEVRREDLAYAVEMAEGECRVGLLRGENPATITLRPPGSEAFVLPRGNVQYLEAQPWSLMPEGLEQGLTAQNMADLIDCVLSAAP